MTPVRATGRRRQWASAIGAVLVMLFSQEGGASTIQTAFNDLVSVAVEVAILEIEKGSALKQGDQSCLSIYDAKVVKQFKGVPRKSMTFGNADGLEIGKKYFVALYDKKTYVATRSGILQRQYGLDDNDVYEHDKIAYKTPGEGAGLYDPALDIDMPVVPIRLPRP